MVNGEGSKPTYQNKRGMVQNDSLIRAGSSMLTVV